MKGLHNKETYCTMLNLKDRQLIHWENQGHQCMLIGQFPRLAVSHHAAYLHNAVTMCILETAVVCLSLSLILLLPLSLSFLSHYLFLDSYLREAQVSAPKLTRTHTHSRSRACSSWVFCRLDSHRCSLWLHYCYLNVGGRSAASINGILGTEDEKQDTHNHTRIDIYTCTCRHTLVRKPCRCTLRAIWITNTSAICSTTEYFQPFRHISQQSFDLGSLHAPLGV